MPIYEYRCADCGQLFEELVMRLTEKVNCPKCKSARVVRQMSAFAFRSGTNFVSSSSKSCGGCASRSCDGCGGG